MPLKLPPRLHRETHYQVLAAAPGQHWLCRGQMRDGWLEIRYQLQPSVVGTRLTRTLTFDVGGITRLMMPLLRRRQRMLSQRMAKFYQASAWGVGDASSTASLEGARKEFNEALGMLAAAPANTPQIKDSLELVKQQWFFFENALGQKTGGDKRPQTAVATTGERILEEMEGVVGLYEKLPK